MADTQWPRYQVILQEKEGAPHQDVGSVHAPDPEMALQNARDVFVRRPDCINLWIVPATAIFSKTAQELEEWDASDGEETGRTVNETYYVFCKLKAAGTQILAGTVEASSPVEAMQRGVKKFGSHRLPLAWWVFPARLVVQTNLQDVESMFTPARDKTFRLSSGFHTVSAMRSIRSDERSSPPSSGQKQPESEDFVSAVQEVKEEVREPGST
jgi:ring-1,2-phenylacetyl-CoA epoxidase subunit PaaB